MKILTIVGTRPELIRLSLIIPKLDKYCNHILVHTNQNYDYELDRIFIEELNIREPNYNLKATGSFAEQMSIIFPKLENILLEEKPDKFYVLGDTNSSMGAVIAKRLGIPVYHSEAGNRSYNDITPEEVNRKIIDHCSDILLPYTQNSKERLLKEGIPNHKIFITGNPINEVINKKYLDNSNIDQNITKKFNLNPKEYFLVTLHRQENVDNKDRLQTFIKGLELIANQYNYPIIISAHPRLKNRLENFKIEYNDKFIKIKKPFGFFDFLMLQEHALCVLTDSGTVMEEACIFNVPCIILRDSHERPECQEVGSCLVSGCNMKTIYDTTIYAINSSETNLWRKPIEYEIENTSDIIVKLLLSSYFKG